MAHSLVKHRKSTHNVPPARLLETFSTPLDKLEHVLGPEGVAQFRASFGDRDRHGDGELDLHEAVEAYSDMGARIGVAELRAWLHAAGASRSLRLADFVIAYANLIFPADSDFRGLVKQVYTIPAYLPEYAVNVSTLSMYESPEFTPQPPSLYEPLHRTRARRWGEVCASRARIGTWPPSRTSSARSS
jgi:hypothetical protein